MYVDGMLLNTGGRRVFDQKQTVSRYNSTLKTVGNLESIQKDITKHLDTSEQLSIELHRGSVHIKQCQYIITSL